MKWIGDLYPMNMGIMMGVWALREVLWRPFEQGARQGITQWGCQTECRSSTSQGRGIGVQQGAQSFVGALVTEDFRGGSSAVPVRRRDEDHLAHHRLPARGSDSETSPESSLHNPRSLPAAPAPGDFASPPMTPHATTGDCRARPRYPCTPRSGHDHASARLRQSSRAR